MRRRDGKPKLKARRARPIFEGGFKDRYQEKNKNIKLEKTTKYHSVVSFFCGCGGMDLGFLGGFKYLGNEYRNLPFKIIRAFDNSPDAIETYNLNIGENTKLCDLGKANLLNIPDSDILIGGFPCQDFSSAGTKMGLNSNRGRLYQVMVEYIKIHKPSLVIGENVPHLGKLQKGKYLEQIIHDFEAAGYKVTVWNLYAPDFGLPQSRRRIFIIGVRDDLVGFPVQPEPTHKFCHIPIDVALSDLEEIEDETITNQSQYFVSSKASRGGGQGDHVNQVGKVAYCIRANSRGRIQYHHRLNRRLTVRECARLQSFPDEFVFPYSTQRNLTLIGNAVPPILAHAVACSTLDYLSKDQSSSSHELISDTLENQIEKSRNNQLELKLGI